MGKRIKLPGSHYLSGASWDSQAPSSLSTSSNKLVGHKKTPFQTIPEEQDSSTYPYPRGYIKKVHVDFTLVCPPFLVNHPRHIFIAIRGAQK